MINPTGAKRSELIRNFKMMLKAELTEMGLLDRRVHYTFNGEKKKFDAKVVWLEEDHQARLNASPVKTTAEINRDYHAHRMTSIPSAATVKQVHCLLKLGVDVSGEISTLTKSRASALISAAKSGDGIGYLGAFFTDGSN